DAMPRGQSRWGHQTTLSDCTARRPDQAFPASLADADDSARGIFTANPSARLTRGSQMEIEVSIQPEGCPEITGGGGPDERECRRDRCARAAPPRSSHALEEAAVHRRYSR